MTLKTISADGKTSTSELQECRCICRFRTLLGKYGRDEKGVFFEKKYRKYIEMKVYGDCRIEIKCPACFRVHKFHLRG